MKLKLSTYIHQKEINENVYKKFHKKHAFPLLDAPELMSNEENKIKGGKTF